jgi:hypothetical protein
LSQPALAQRLATEGRLAAAGRFSAARMARDTFAIYEELLQRAGKAGTASRRGDI